MNFSTQNVDDIRRYYEKTYCKLKEFGDKLWFLQKIETTPDGYEVRLVDSDNETWVILLDNEEPYHMDFALPHKAMFNFRNTVFQLQRIPARQYKRGIHPENTQLIEIFTGKSLTLDFKRLESFINKQAYISLNEAIFGKRGSTVVGMALSPRMAWNALNQMVFVDNVGVAVYDRAANKLKTPDGMANAYKLFKPEVQALLDPHYATQPTFE